MKKFMVIGNPIDHSLSPKLHNYWLKINNVDAIYEKQKFDESQFKDLILRIKQKKINGINVTVPFKKKIIPYLDLLSPEAKITQSVNTIYSDNDKIVGHNTDIQGFELSIKKTRFDINNKEALVLGAGGVAPSIIFALNKMKVSKITLTNRTREKAESLKDIFKNLTIIDWGKIIDFDIIINTTSLGLNKNENIDLNFSKIEKNKFFYDVIYNPNETNFLKIGKKLGNKTENGKMMFIYQAAAAFKIWHGIDPVINNNLINLLNK